MSDRAIDYVSDLGSDRVSRAEKHVLLAIAHHVTERHGTANLPLEELAAEVFRTKRHLRRVFKGLDHLLDYTPGLGSGNFSQFRFLELADGNGTQRGRKGDISVTAIRKENLNPDPDLNPPGPLCARCGGQGKVHQAAHTPGPRLIPCPDCNKENPRKPPRRVA